MGVYSLTFGGLPPGGALTAGAMAERAGAAGHASVCASDLVEGAAAERVGMMRDESIDVCGELDVQRHAMYCLWMMDQGKVHVPPAWLTASLKGEWSAPHGMPSDWLPTVLRFRVDENTFAEFIREVRESKKTT